MSVRIESPLKCVGLIIFVAIGSRALTQSGVDDLRSKEPAVRVASVNLPSGVTRQAIYPVGRNTSTTSPLLSPPAPLNSNAATDAGNDEYPDIATDGQGHWICVWHSNDSLGGTIGNDLDILISQSTDDGLTWTPPAALNTYASADSRNDEFPRIAADRNGVWIVVWETLDSLGGTIGNDGDIAFSRSTDDGYTWSVSKALNTNAGSDSGGDTWPSLATDGNVHWVVVWQSFDSLGGTIGTDWDVLYSRSQDNGLTWSAPASAASDAATDQGHDGAPDVTTDGQGHWIAVWDGGGQSERDIMFARSSDNGATWTPLARLNTDGDTDTKWDREPCIRTDGSGHWVTVWDGQPGTGVVEEDILVAHSTDSGVSWTPPAALNSNAAGDIGRDHWPQLTTDGKGRWACVWYSTDPLGGTVGADEDIMIELSTAHGQSWTSITAANSNATTDSGNDRFAEVASNGKGVWMIVWQSTDTLGNTIGSDYDLLFTRFVWPIESAATWRWPLYR